MPPAIIVENLSKSYQIGAAQHQQTFREAAVDLLASPFRRLGSAFSAFRSSAFRSSSEETIWALKDVSFEVQPGEVVGIIGRNGAGKSTLLKILSRITEPTAGRAVLRGRVASLLEVGTGFHPELTGRENIYLNGAILGMKRAEITRKFDEIVAFSEIEKFLDTPVKRYSSGMYVRLAFAVAAHLEPEILIVDEVLAVGDAEFQKKCLGKMQEVSKGGGRTVLFVSHNMAAVQQLCGRCIVLAAGQKIGDARSELAVTSYLDTLGRAADSHIASRTDRRGRGNLRLISVTTCIDGNEPVDTLVAGRRARFIFRFDRPCKGADCQFTFYDGAGRAVAHFSSTLRSAVDCTDGAEENAICCELDELLLVPGCYTLNIAALRNGELEDHLESAVRMHVEGGLIRGRAITRATTNASASLPHRWIFPSSDR